MKNIKHYFASANTGDGFVCRFDQINNKNGFMYIIKGGSGTGKSTLCKKVGEYFMNNNYSIEYFHCSSDVDSLDGVRIVEANICIVDGTSPHAIEPNILGVNSKIINTAEFISNSISKYSQKIEDIICTKKDIYQKVYSYLKAAKSIYQVEDFNNNLNEKFENNSLFSLVNKAFELENYYIQDNVDNGSTYIRKLFKSAVFDKGFYNFDTINHYENVVYMPNLRTNDFVLEAELLAKKKIETILLYNPLLSNICEAMYIPSKDYIIISNEVENYKGKIFKELIDNVCGLLNSCVAKHKELEKYYIESVDFEGLNQLYFQTINDILKRID